MNTRHIVVGAAALLWATAAAPAGAQNPHRLTLDFATSGLEGERLVRHGQQVVFWVKNVNRLLYDVNITSVNKDFNLAAPGVFKSNLLPAEETFEKARTSGPETEAFAALPGEREKFEETLKLFNQAVDNLLKAAKLDNDIANHVSNYKVVNPTTIAQANASVTRAVKGVLTMADLSATGPGNAPLPGDINDARQPLLQGVINVYSALERAYEAYEKNPGPDTDALEKNEEKYHEAEERYRAIRKADNEGELRTEFASAARLYQSVVNGDLFEASGGEIIATGDAVEYTVEVKPNADSQNVQGLKTLKETVRVRVHGQPKIDFSTGLFVSFLNDENYVLATPSGSETPVVRRGNDNDASFKTGALVHVYKKRNGGLQPAFSLGVGLADEKIQYLAGGSLLFGDNRRFVLTIGATYGSVTRLEPGLKVDEAVPDDRTDITRTVFRPGLFVGLSYNFN